MCIRDSIIGDYQGFPVQGEQRFLAVGLNPVAGVGALLEPVSYTPLDVYKRQLMDRTMAPASTRDMILDDFFIILALLFL